MTVSYSGIEAPSCCSGKQACLSNWQLMVPICEAGMECSRTVQCACNSACCNDCVGQASTVFETEANHHVQQRYIKGSTSHASRVCQKGTLNTRALPKNACKHRWRYNLAMWYQACCRKNTNRLIYHACRSDGSDVTSCPDKCGAWVWMLGVPCAQQVPATDRHC